MVKIARTSFEFPKKFIKYEGEDMSSSDVKISTFTCDETSRGAFFYVFDFAESASMPEFEDSFVGAINGALGEMDARDFEWLSSKNSEDIIWAQFQYSMGEAKQTGFCWAFRKGRHTEMLILLGGTQSYPENFIARVRASIKVSK